MSLFGYEVQFLPTVVVWSDASASESELEILSDVLPNQESHQSM